MALDDDVLVDLVVAAARVGVGQFFVAPEPVPEQPQIPVRVIGVLQPAVHEHEAPVDPVPGRFRVTRRAGHDPAKLLLRARRQHLVGVEDEHPVVAERQVFQRPVFLLGPGAAEMELHDFGPQPFGHFDRAVRALRIDDEHLVRPRDRAQAAFEVGRLVFDRHQDGNGDGRVHRARKCQGLFCGAAVAGCGLWVARNAAGFSHNPQLTTRNGHPEIFIRRCSEKRHVA